MSAPLPSWLDPQGEVLQDTPGGPRPGAGSPFVAAVFDALLRLGCSADQAVEVVACVALETGWGAKYRANNLGGWKITADYAKAHPGARWWRAAGHIASGDSPTVYYRAFDTVGDFLREWLLHFAPKPEARAPYTRYRTAGSVFWTGPVDSFAAELIDAGYRGPVTARNPERSLREHRSICRTVRRMLGLPQPPAASVARPTAR